jgi:hypothetical protein
MRAFFSFLAVTLFALLIGINANSAFAAPPTKPTPTPKLKKETPTPIPVIIMDDYSGRNHPKINSLEIRAIDPLLRAQVAATAVSYMAPVSPTEEILAAIDVSMLEVWDVIVDTQLQYYEMSKGRYMQGLKSHSTIPVDGVHEFPDLYLIHPTDFPASWNELRVLPFSPSPYQYWMDTYNGPFGPGFVFCVSIAINTSVYQRCMNYGGEIWREQSWTEVTTP